MVRRWCVHFFLFGSFLFSLFASQLFYDGGKKCGSHPDPNMANCLNIALAFMLNTATGWTNATRLHFFISYSNDIDRNNVGALVGPAGDAKWKGLLSTWITAMKHPRYLKGMGDPCAPCFSVARDFPVSGRPPCGAQFMQDSCGWVREHGLPTQACVYCALSCIIHREMERGEGWRRGILKVL